MSASNPAITVPAYSPDVSGLTLPSPAPIQQDPGYQHSNGLFQGPNDIDDYARSAMMVQFLYRRFGAYGWLQQDQVAQVPVSVGIVMRAKNGDDTEFISEPQTMDNNVKTICANLNLAIVFSMSSDVTDLIFTRIEKDDSEITLWPYTITVPIIDSLEVLANNRTDVGRGEFCCLIRKEKVALVWGNAAEEMIVRGSDVETKLISFVCPPDLGVLN